jgi:hypothetical protein
MGIMSAAPVTPSTTLLRIELTVPLFTLEESNNLLRNDCALPAIEQNTNDTINSAFFILYKLL